MDSANAQIDCGTPQSA